MSLSIERFTPFEDPKLGTTARINNNLFLWTEPTRDYCRTWLLNGYHKAYRLDSFFEEERRERFHSIITRYCVLDVTASSRPLPMRAGGMWNAKSRVDGERARLLPLLTSMICFLSVQSVAALARTAINGSVSAVCGLAKEGEGNEHAVCNVRSMSTIARFTWELSVL